MIRLDDFSPEVTFLIEDEGIFAETPVNELFSKKVLVIPKEIFIEAYNKWIKGEKE